MYIYITFFFPFIYPLTIESFCRCYRKQEARFDINKLKIVQNKLKIVEIKIYLIEERRSENQNVSLYY